MKIAIVGAPYYAVPPVAYGGTERVIQYLIKGLLEEGHEPILLAAGDSKVDCQLIPIVPKAIALPLDRAELPAFRRKVKRIDAKTQDILAKLAPKVDVIHSHGFDLLPLQKYPSVTTLHVRLTLDDIDYYRDRKNLYYVSISQNQQISLPDLQYIGVVYNGMDPAEFPVVIKPENYLCYIGRFDRDKSPHLAIQLALRLGIKIKLAGKIDHEGNSYFDEEIKPLLRHPLVEYIGEVSHKDKIELVSKARCNLHPISFREPFGLTVMEAAYCGTPTLTIRRGSMPELIEEGRTGVLIEDFVEGYYRMQECFDMDRRYIAQRARTLFNYKTMTRQYLKAYQAVIGINQLHKKEEKLLRNLTAGARRQLQAMWETEEKSIDHL
ncbi:MAG TPA: glycosyltransferase family 4 protein [Patescibacteria group bacterium]|nr:glycosyltransferase family 4 protein [Patescibacteria group bacterium]